MTEMRHRGTLGLEHFVGLLCALALCLAAFSPALAQSPPKVAEGQAPSLAEILKSGPEDLTAEQVDAIVAVLDDTQARQALRAALALLSGAEPTAAEPQVPLSSRLRTRLDAALSSIPAFGTMTDLAIARDMAAGYTSRPATVAFWTAVLLVIGLITGGIVRLALARAEAQAATRIAVRTPLSAHMGRGAITLSADFVGIAAFAVGMTIAYLLISPRNPRAAQLFEDLLMISGLTLSLIAVGRFVLAPRHPDRRWTGMGEEMARRIALSLASLLSAAIVLVLPIIYVRYLGLPEAAFTLTRLTFSTGVSLFSIALVWLHRRDLVLLARGAESAGAPALLVASGVTAYLLMVWLIWSAAQLSGAEALTVPALVSMGLVFAVPLAARSLLSWMPSTLASRRGQAALAWIVSLGTGLWLLFAVWGLDPAGAGMEGRPVTRAILRACTMLLLGLIGWLVIRGWLDRKIVQITKDASEEAAAASKAKRLATILPLIRVFALSVIGTLVALSVLSAIGIDIAPLLAGAGVVGLAIGFGAQSLVSDVVSGIFFLMDDAFRIGEYVEVGNTRGTVEGISLRSLRLRHHMGAVHTLPFGQIHSLTNYSRDWAVMRLEFRVDPATDLGLLKKLVKRIGAELMNDETLGPSFIEPLKSQGVRRVEEDALIVAVKYKARPGTQFTIRKTAYQRLLTAFREAGINLIAKGVTVRLETDESLSPQEQKQVGAAAARVVAESEAAGAKS